jgi:hypothetical protein
MRKAANAKRFQTYAVSIRFRSRRARWIAFYEKFLVRRDVISNPARQLRRTEAKG